MRRGIGRPIFRCLAILPPVVIMLTGVAAPVHGVHLFRQAHVAANIEKYVEHGLSLRPETYNLDVPRALFDFPAYQLLVAWISRSFGTPPLPTGRGLNVLLFALSLVVLDRLLARTGVTTIQRFTASVLFAYAPLCLFFMAAPMVDGLALLASFVSLYAFVRGEEKASGIGVWWSLMVAAGVLSALIKSPVYLPVFIAVWWHGLRARGRRVLKEPALLFYGLAIAGAVVLFKLYANAVNGASGFLSRGEAEEYFGPLGSRLQPSRWVPIAFGLLCQASNPLTLGLSVAGVWAFTRRSRSRWASLYMGLLVGCGITLVVFFEKYSIHDYYLLPFVFPLAFFGGYAMNLGLTAARAERRAGRAWSPVLGQGMPLLTLITTLVLSGLTFRTMSQTVPSVASRGEWIRGLTEPDDFVVYVVERRWGTGIPSTCTSRSEMASTWGVNG